MWKTEPGWSHKPKPFKLVLFIFKVVRWSSSNQKGCGCLRWRINPNCWFSSSSPMSLRFKAISEATTPNPDEKTSKRQRIDLGNGSEVVYIPRFLTLDESWKLFDYLNKEIPWTRPTIRVCGRSCVQVRNFLS